MVQGDSRDVIADSIRNLRHNVGMYNPRQYYVYILTNKSNKVIYIGMTNNLERRIYEHKQKLIDGFTEKYNLDKLVWFEQTSDVRVAIEKEKQLKNWHRSWKIDLVNKDNPDWRDLAMIFEILKQVQDDRWCFRVTNRDVIADLIRNLRRS